MHSSIRKTYAWRKAIPNSKAKTVSTKRKGNTEKIKYGEFAKATTKEERICKRV